MAAVPTQAKRYTFAWEGKNKSGSVVKGLAQSSNPNLVRAQLRRQGITPTKVQKKSARQLGERSKKITTKDITLFSRQLTTMINAGVPLVQALEIISSGQSNKKMEVMVVAIKNDIESGNTLSAALRRHPDQFDELFCNITAAGEQSGTLDKLLNEISSYREKTDRLRAKVKKALVYPAGVISVAILLTLLLLTYAIPQFEALFKSVGSDLPLPTKIVVQISNFLQDSFVFIMLVLVGSVVGFFYMKKKSKAFSAGVDRLSLRLPLFGDLLSKASTARFARTLSTMSAAGVPLVEGLSTVAGTAGNAVFEDAILQIRDEISSGQRLQLAMQRSGLFTNMVIRMVTVGEESGSLDTILDKVASYYEEEVEDTVDNLTALLEPMIIVFVGVVIGGLVLTMYLPIFKLGEAF